MIIDISKQYLKTHTMVQTKDWGVYLLKQFAIPQVDEDKDNKVMFTGAQNIGIEGIVDTLQKYGHIWIMKNHKTLGYPIDFIRNKSIDEVPDYLFERIFNANEIRKISAEPITVFDWDEKSCVYTLKLPKTTVLGNLGAFLDNKFQ
jgi:hypothetical protein